MVPLPCSIGQDFIAEWCMAARRWAVPEVQGTNCGRARLGVYLAVNRLVYVFFFFRPL